MIENQNWPATQIVQRKINDLKPYERNARTHSPAQIKQIADSMAEWGWTNPILIDENDMIIAGHGRLEAAKALKILEVPVMIAGGWTEAQKKAYILADNQLALNAGWDTDLLKVEIDELKALDFDIGLIGFENDFLAALDVTGIGETDPDSVPELPTEPTAVLGDIWRLGNHVLVCGDSTDADCVAKCLDGSSPHLMVTDPPYGVKYDAAWREKVQGGQNLSTGKVTNDNRADWREAWALFPGDVVYIWHASLHTHTVANSLVECDFNLRSLIIWTKQNFTISRGDYHWKHENCWYAVKDKATGHWNGDRKQTTVWEINNNNMPPGTENEETLGHSTQKPIECMKRPIENNSKIGDHIYEPFSGSGTTIIAGEMTGRIVHAIELNPSYVDMAVKRWEKFTGKIATRD